MRIPLSSPRVVLAVAIALVALALPAGASADPTGSQITTPSARVFVQFDKFNPRSLHVEGETEGGMGDVDLRCYYGSTSVLIKGGVHVSDGLFATDVELSLTLYGKMPVPKRYCVLRAVPTGTAPVAAPNMLSAWKGRTISWGQAWGIGNYDYWVSAPQLSAYNDYLSVGSCGICDTFLYKPGDYAESNPMWWGNAAIYHRIPGTGTGTRSAMQVDGVNAYAADAAHSFGLDGSAGFPAIGYTQQVDQSNGNLTIDEHSPFATCSPQPEVYPPTPASCSSFTSPVELHRTITQDNNGLQITIVDKWSSTDGKPHQIDAWYDDTAKRSNYAMGQETKFNFSWTGEGSKVYPGGSISVAGSAGKSVFVKPDGSTPDGGDGTNPIGALTYGQQPSELIMRVPVSAGQNIVDWQAHYLRTVPAAGHLTIAHVYTHGFSLPAIQPLVAGAELATTAPTVSIAAPADGATVDAASAHVTGTAAAADGKPSVSVNGVAATVADDGSWSAEVPLAEGANTLTAVAENALGVQAEASRTVQRPFAAAPPAGDANTTTAPAQQAAPVSAAAAAKCRVPALKGKTLRTAKLKLRKAHCRVGKVTRKSSKRIRPGRVLASKPGAGRVRKAGTRIALTLAKP